MVNFYKTLLLYKIALNVDLMLIVDFGFTSAGSQKTLCKSIAKSIVILFSQNITKKYCNSFCQYC